MRRYLSWIEGLTTNQDAIGSNPIRRTILQQQRFGAFFIIKSKDCFEGSKTHLFALAFSIAPGMLRFACVRGVMFYLTNMLGRPVFDSSGEKLGIISDLAISTGEVFPRITSLAFKGPGKTPFMISWRKYVSEFTEDDITLNCESFNIRFSYLQPDEILLARDLLDQQIVDTQGLKVVRVNDLKLSPSGTQLRLLGAEVGIRGILRGLHPLIERMFVGLAGLFGKKIGEHLIAWNYMDLIDRDLSKVKLSVDHKRLEELHPADVADILEQLDPKQRAEVFQHLDKERSADVMAELEEEFQAETLDDLDEKEASGLLGQMDPDDAADIIRDLPYEKAETLLRLMGVEDAQEIQQLLGYKDDTAGGLMTTQFVALDEDTTVEDTLSTLRTLDEDFPTVHYIYITASDTEELVGVLSLRTLALAEAKQTLKSIMYPDVITISPDESAEDVASDISKYDLIALPVVDASKRLLGLVTVDDAIDIIEDVSEDQAKSKRLKTIVVGVLAALGLLAIYTIFLIAIL